MRNITDYDSEIAGLTENFGEYENLFLLQALACKICLQYCEQYSYKNMLESMLEYGEHTGSVLELINLVCNTEHFYFLPDVASDYDLGYEYAENSGMFTEVYAQMGTLRNYIDYEGYGRDIRLTEGGIHTKNGYISLTDNIVTYYDSTEDISELYE